MNKDKKPGKEIYDLRTIIRTAILVLYDMIAV